MLISKDYASLNARLHAESEGYGSSSWRYIGPALKLMERRGCKSLLDYGCGKGSLLGWMPNVGVDAAGYDPAMEQYSDDPDPVDFVVCTDVLEHIEPEYLGDVLSHLESKMLKAGLFVIGLGEAKKTLPDGRNAHLIIQPPEWWLTKLNKRWSVEPLGLEKASLAVYVEAGRRGR